MDKLNKEKVNKTVLVVLFAAYLLFNGILFALHEPWRDEANVWLMAKELSPVTLFREIKYQGHPCLWYLLVMPFAKAGLPFRTIEALSLLVMGVCAWFFLWKAPFHGITKACCLFSPIFTYFYPVVARNYCLIALLLVILAWQFPKRNIHCVRYGVLLGLLVQADTIAIAQAGMLSAMWLLESIYRCWKSRSLQLMKRVLTGIWIPAASLLLWVLQFYQVSDSPQFRMRDLGAGEFFSEIRNFSYGILIRMTGRGQSFCLAFFVLCLAAFLLVSFRLKNGWAMIVVTGSFLFQAAFSAVIYQLHMWHYISLGFVFVWALWILCKQAEEKGISDMAGKLGIGALEFLLIVLSVGMFVNWNSENESSSLNMALHGLYSDGKNAADYIRENIPPEELIVSADVPMASTVLAYLREYEFYYAGNGQKESYADWSDSQSVSIGYHTFLKWCRETFPERQEFYLLWTNDSHICNAEDLGNCQILYQTKEPTVRGEEYIIYRISLE